MTKYAVIQLAGKQHKVSVGDQITVNRLEVEPDAKISITDVLLIGGDEAKVGTPFVTGAVVTLKAVTHDRGEKIRVATYKAKSRYRKVRGHRQSLTTVEVLSITG
jgi:large subunit ribosomal protein L21